MKPGYAPNKLRKFQRRADAIARRAAELHDALDGSTGRDPMLVKFAAEVSVAAGALARRIEARREKEK